MLIVSFVFMGCDMGNSSIVGDISPFEGTWQASYQDGEYEVVYVAIMSGNAFFFQVTGESDSDSIIECAKGAFSYTETEITLTFTHESIDGSTWEEVSGDYAVKKTPYSFSQGNLILFEKTFIKQS
jgi:hypothetical protein